MSEVLLYNIETQKELKIKMLCHKLNIGFRTVKKDEYGYKLSYLLQLSSDGEKGYDADFDDELMYLSNIDGGMLTVFLSQLRKQKTPVELKAVRTDTNVGFTSSQLYKEISAEHNAIKRGEIAHKTEENQEA